MTTLIVGYMAAAVGTYGVVQASVRRDRGALFTFGFPPLAGLFWPLIFASLIDAVIVEARE